ncbi:glycosyltransferase 87 family protein [Polymorphospora rubra]|uniref:glycosyltransferase 87 family protein n=1 Tax=Polymorphospora rubra TaxID=338584 RepID=UPI0033FDC27F
MPATVERRPSRPAPANRLARGFDRRTVIRIGIIAGVLYAAWLAVEAFGRPYIFFDMKIYHGAVVWWAGGNDLYDFTAPETTLGFTYPPFAGLAMLPMAGLSVIAAGWVNLLVSLAALTLVLVALIVPIADRHGWSRWFAVALAVSLAVAIEPVRETFGYGQVNLLLFGLIMADLVALRRRAQAGLRPPVAGGVLRRLWHSGAWAGAGIGLASAIKLTPALFIVYLLITRQWRAAMTAIGTAIGVTTAGFVLAGHESATYFTSVLWQTDRIGKADMTPNQSLAGLLARLYDSVETPTLLWLAFSLVVLAIGLSRASSAHADGDELAAFALVGLTANVISPISWTHHLVFVIPAIVVLADAALRRRAASRGPGRIGSPLPNPLFTASSPGPRTPIWFPTLTGLRHASAAVALYLLMLVAPIWAYEHQLPHESHYQNGLFGALMENSLALALILLVAALPWRPGAEPAFYTDSMMRLHRRLLNARLR